MKPGPAKKPTALNLVAGNPGKRRIPKHEPTPPVTRPSPTADLCETGKSEWRRIVDQLADLGLMTNLDVAVLTAYCDAFGEWTTARRAFALIQERNKITGGYMVRTPNGSVQIAPLVSIIRAARADMVRYAAELGMTPSARAGMEIDVRAKAPSTQADPAAAYFG